MKKLIYIVSLIIGLTACGSDNSNEVSKQLKSSYDQEGQQVELSGHLSLSTLEVVKDGRIIVSLNPDKKPKGNPLAQISLGFGQDKNQIYVPEEFRDNDLEIYDNAGKKHAYDSKVTITGTVEYIAKNWKDEVNVEIESLDSVDPNDKIAVMKIKTKQRTRDMAQAEADRREKETGDPNNYAFRIIVDKIEVR